MRTQVPVSEGLTHELIEFWESIFGPSDEVTPELLLGDELQHNLDDLYIERRDGRLAGTCHVTVPRKAPRLGGFGEVATDPEFRGSGIATDLCGQAAEEFSGSGGEAIFLGTVNPNAARIYHRQGWRKLAGATVMARISSGDSPESFLVNYFHERGPVSVSVASSAVRVPMIPLIVTPHDWQVLDANAGMYSTRYREQNSCMGLYPRYQAVVRDGRGACFACHADENRLVGLSTARLDDSGGCQVDGFTHARHMSAWGDLVQAAHGWGVTNGATVSWAAVSVEDEDKQAKFESLGFREVGATDRFDLDGRSVEAVRMEMD